jgi:hypothetical protein
VARNTKGYKHTVEMIEKMRKSSICKKHTEEVKQTRNTFFKGENETHSEVSLTLLKAVVAKRDKLSVLGIKVEITNLETKITTIYESIRKAAEAIDSDIKTILRREKLQKYKGINTPYKKKYIIVIKR